MPSILGFDQHLAVIETAASALVDAVETAGPDAEVVTCPDWQARDLVVHQGIIHRWAAGNLRGDEGAKALEEHDVLTSVPDDDLADWSRDGARELLSTLASVDPDVDALVFVNNAPRPRDFWARRQAHETTIHSVDALAASLGRVPTSADLSLDTDLAVDGIDELLRGFFTRRRSKLYDGEPVSVRVAPSDSSYRWTLRAGPEGAVTDYEDADADVTFTGTAVQLYLGLWNRGDEIAATGDEALLDRWRGVQHVTWG
ncbi:MAG: maleylpyruvate isomerase family mycothiol-dependent enzyme [Nocardioidaceae bacterium]